MAHRKLGAAPLERSTRTRHLLESILGIHLMNEILDSSVSAMTGVIEKEVNTAAAGEGTVKGDYPKESATCLVDPARDLVVELDDET